MEKTIIFKDLITGSLNNRLHKLIITLPKGWEDISHENPGGATTFIDGTITEPGILQISTAEYEKGELPSPTYTDLIDLSVNVGLKNQFGEPRNKQSGDCRYGKYGMSEFARPDFPYIAVWYLSDGKNFIFATFICSANPGQDELDNVKEILLAIRKKSFLGF